MTPDKPANQSNSTSSKETELAVARSEGTSHLWPELLADVFFYIRDSDPPTVNLDPKAVDAFKNARPPPPPTPGWPHYRLGWIQVTHVCHYWREVALSQPRLWTCFSSHDMSVEWIREMRRRASKCRCSIVIDRPFGKDRERRNAVFGENILQQVESLDIQRASSDDLKEAFGDSGSAPVLKSLAVRGSHEAVSSLHAPQLRSLILVGFIRWDAPLFSATLVDLRIGGGGQRYKAHEPENPSPLRIATALRKMPGLQVLHLRSVIPRFTDPGFLEDGGAPVELPALKEFSLLSHDVFCIGFMDSVRVPPTARVSICLEDHHKTPLVSLLKAGGPGMSRSKRALCFHGSGPSLIRLDFWDECPDFQQSATPAPSISIRILRWGSPPAEPTVSLPIDDLTYLILDNQGATNSLWQCVRWSDALRAAVNLETVHLKGAIAVSEFVQATPRADDETSGPVDVLFPKLKRVIVSDVDLGHTKVDEEDRYLHSELAQALETRRKLGYGLHGLEVRLHRPWSERYSHGVRAYWNNGQKRLSSAVTHVQFVELEE
ncbi:hypothetical protein BV25DRAFT_1829397 [Artomyces pyxidatus]|uniref:Uncharacterized protein n=1 Tax=Artomyces pyxidatus TaxID=48021 RepID=A0ACB8SS77_9AGAM|nr:hypothetical protein BV25DRAFT_1829397 [Artomyces pyxidatus]